MHHEAQKYGYHVAGPQTGPMNAPTPTRTLAARLESTAYMLMAQCGRIEDALARVNGTPRAGTDTVGGVEKNPDTAPMAQSVEALEQQVERLCDLANNLEQVA